MNNKTLFFKELYEAELERREKITSSLVIPIGILSLLGSGIIYLIQKLEFFIDFINTMVLIILIVATIFFCYSVYYLIKSYFGYTYKFLPTPKELEQYWNKLREYYKTQDVDYKTADAEFEQYIENSYVDSTTENTWNNDSKSEYLHKANRAMVWCLVLILACSFPVLVKEKDEIQKVQIVNERLTIQNMENNMGKEQKPSSANQQIKPSIQKPEPPPLRQIKEGVQPPKPKK